MLQSESAVRELTRQESLALVPTVPVGRLVFTDRALPVVMPVNFVLDGNRIVVRTGHGSVLGEAVRGAVVAFEVDDFDDTYRNGWTVTITGRVRHVVDPLERSRLLELPLHSYAGDDLAEVLVVPVELVTGRRVGTGPLGHAPRP